MVIVIFMPHIHLTNTHSETNCRCVLITTSNNEEEKQSWPTKYQLQLFTYIHYLLIDSITIWCSVRKIITPYLQLPTLHLCCVIPPYILHLLSITGPNTNKQPRNKSSAGPNRSSPAASPTDDNTVQGTDDEKLSEKKRTAPSTG